MSSCKSDAKGKIGSKYRLIAGWFPAVISQNQSWGRMRVIEDKEIFSEFIKHLWSLDLCCIFHNISHSPTLMAFEDARSLPSFIAEEN